MTVPAALLWAALGQVLLVLVLIWVLPFLARREFLFGVYLGVDRERLRVTREIFRTWNLGAVILALCVLAGCVGLWATGWIVGSFSLPLLSAVFGGVALFLHCHARSRHYGVRTPEVAVAPVQEIPLVREAVPLILQVLPWIVFAGVMVWAAFQWSEVRAGTASVSSWSFFLGPTLAMGLLLVPLHFASWAFVRTKAPLKTLPTEDARRRSRLYRRAFAWYLWALGMLMAFVVSYVLWDTVHGLIGDETFGRGPVVAALSVTLAGLVGAILLAAKVTHGLGPVGKRKGVVDQRRWVGGLFYFDPEDPAFLIQQRFGLTVNFGNRRALTIACILLIVFLSVALLPLGWLLWSG